MWGCSQDVADAREAGRWLWLVRHGESTWNALGLVQGQSPRPWADPAAGGREARRSAGRLAGRPVGALYSSDLRRALETAGPSRAPSVDREVVVDVTTPRTRLRRSRGRSLRAALGAFSGIDEGRVADADAAPRAASRSVSWSDGSPASSSSCGTLRPGDVVLVVHGGVVRACLAHLDGVAPEAMRGPRWATARSWPALGGAFAQGGQGPGSNTAAAAVPSSSPSEDPT